MAPPGGNLTIGSVISGSGWLIEIGGGAVTLSASNTFTGNIIDHRRHAGRESEPIRRHQPDQFGIGQSERQPRRAHDHGEPGRHARLRRQPNVTGAGGSTGAPNLVINQGTVTNTAGGNAHNYLGSQLTLNGGTLTGTGGGTSAAPQWNFVFGNTTGTVSVGTATPSLITGTGAEDGLALTSTTTFYITGTGGLTVAVPLQNGNAGATPSTLIETGAGLLNLTASNNYTGGTIINGGTLQVGNVNALQSGVVTDKSPRRPGLHRRPRDRQSRRPFRQRQYRLGRPERRQPDAERQRK